MSVTGCDCHVVVKDGTVSDLFCFFGSQLPGFTTRHKNRVLAGGIAESKQVWLYSMLPDSWHRSKSEAACLYY